MDSLFTLGIDLFWKCYRKIIAGSGKDDRSPAELQDNMDASEQLISLGQEAEFFFGRALENNDRRRSALSPIC